MPVEVRKADRVTKYTKRWQKNAQDDNETHRQERIDDYAELVNGYYDGATDLYEYGWGQSFHFCRFYKGEPFDQGVARHEHYLALKMGLKANQRVLDVGCGIGAPAREISRFTDANIVGINNNDYQLQRANMKTVKAGLTEKVSFAKGDFMKISEQFGENSFDAIYAIEATCHAPTFEGIYGEIFKALKPGGMFGVYEWCMTDAWDQSIPEHKAVAHGIELGNGIAQMRTFSDARNALKTVGFEILEENDLADNDDPVEWYMPLEGDMRKAQTAWDMFTVFRKSRVGRFLTQNALWYMEKFRMVPKGTYDVGESLIYTQAALVKGGQTKLFTPMAFWLCRKPE